MKFSEVKKDQLFQHGCKCNGVWSGLTTYKKTSKNSASPAFGQEHHVYGFDNPDLIVRIEAGLERKAAVQAIRLLKEKFIRQQDFEFAAHLRDAERTLDELH